MTERNKDLTAAQMLFEARTSGRRKREISTISKLLCIREEYLVALEKGDYKAIPEAVYVLGFARNYAMELGLNPTEIVAKIKKEMGLDEEFESELDNESDEENDDDSSEKNPNAIQNIGHKISEKLPKYIYKHWKFLVSVLVGIVILVVGLSIVFSLSNESERYNSGETAAMVVQEPEYKQNVREKFGTENSATANVVLQATQESWVKIEDARGNTVFSRVLVAGDVYYVPNGDKYKGTFGNAGGIDVWVNGKLIPKLGAVNARKSGVLMTPEGLMPAPETPVVTEE